MIIFIGVSGAGKGTQSKLLVDERGYTHLSTGEMLRQYATPAQRAGMLEGRWLDDDEIITMVERALANIPDRNKVILDGFPRTLVQAQWVINQLERGKLRLEAVINLDASPDMLKERLLARGRMDDTEPAIGLRFREYSGMTRPIIKLFEDHGIHVSRIDAGQTPEMVHKAVLQCLSSSVELLNKP